MTIFICSAFAQQKKFVHLKNGSIIYGAILEEHPDSIVKILSNKNLWVFKMQEVEKITVKNEHYYLADKEGGRAYLGLMTTLDGIDASFALGYRFKKRYTAGLGVGLGMLDDDIYIPIYTMFQADFDNQKKTPFIYLNTGYSFVPTSSSWWREDYKAYGFLFQAGLGYKIRFVRFNGINLKLGYRMQALYESYTTTNWQSTNPIKINKKTYMHRMEFGINFTI